MKCFFALYGLEFKRCLNIRVFAAVLLILIIAVIGLVKGVDEYKNTLADIKELKAKEVSRFKTIRNYDEYSNTGIEIFFIPSPSAIFFSGTAVMYELSARINTIIRLNIDNNAKGKRAFKNNTRYRWRLSVVVLLLGTLLTMYMAFAPMKHREYFRLLSTQCSPGTAMWALLTARFTIVLLGLLLIFGGALLTAVLKSTGITPASFAGLLPFLAATFLMICFFFLAGALCGTLRSKTTGILALLTTWTVFVFIIPTVLNSLLETRADSLPSAPALHNKKLTIMNDFERRAFEETGGYPKTTLEESRRIVEGYKKKEFKEISALEEQFESDTAEVVDYFDFLNIFTPTTFYNSTAGEAGSRGYGSYLAFYRYARIQWEKFRLFWIDRVYYHDPKELVSFVRTDENLFKGQSRGPAYVKEGLFLNLAYVLILALLLVYRYKRAVFCLPGKFLLQKKDLDIQLDRFDELSAWLVEDDNFKLLLYNLLSGKNETLRKAGFTGRVWDDDTDMVKDKNRKVFSYIPRPEAIPRDITVRDFLAIFAVCGGLSGDKKEELLNSGVIEEIKDKRFGELKKRQAFDVMLTLTHLVKKSDIYLVEDLTTGMTAQAAHEVRLKDRLKTLSEDDALVIFLTSSAAGYDIDITPDEEDGWCFKKLDTWEFMVEANRRKLAQKKGKDNDTRK
jgi:hypothetical protein